MFDIYRRNQIAGVNVGVADKMCGLSSPVQPEDVKMVGSYFQPRCFCGALVTFVVPVFMTHAFSGFQIHECNIFISQLFPVDKRIVMRNIYSPNEIFIRKLRIVECVKNRISQTNKMNDDNRQEDEQEAGRDKSDDFSLFPFNCSVSSSVSFRFVFCRCASAHFRFRSTIDFCCVYPHAILLIRRSCLPPSNGVFRNVTNMSYISSSER